MHLVSGLEGWKGMFGFVYVGNATRRGLKELLVALTLLGLAEGTGHLEFL